MHSEGILGGSRNYTIIVHFHSIFPQTSLFGVQLHIEAPTGLATFHASTCDVNNPSIMPSHDITAIIHECVISDIKYIIIKPFPLVVLALLSFEPAMHDSS